MTGLLVVTAVPAEADAVRAGLADPATTVVAIGVGAAVAGAATPPHEGRAQARGGPLPGGVSAGRGRGFNQPLTQKKPRIP
ncbi:hypothetical protein AB0I76_12580, partial [Micromonospora sp. NPDC049799]